MYNMHMRNNYDNIRITPVQWFCFWHPHLPGSAKWSAHLQRAGCRRQLAYTERYNIIYRVYR